MKLREKRKALKVVRRASRMLGMRSGVFMHKLNCRDADAQAAVAVAAEELDIDPVEILTIIEMILELWAMLSKLFGWDD
ncbi:MAG: hypothetical protein ACYTFQ_18645 [Planctomycetota bacterium]|jgi:hypothetical protein